MEVTTNSGHGSPTARGREKWVGHALQSRGTGRWVRYCLFVWIIAVPVTLITFSVPVSAHGDIDHGGTPVTFAVVVGLPVVVGLLAGITAIALRGQNPEEQIDRRLTVGLGLSFLLLGGAFVVEAATRSLWPALAAGTAGGSVVLWCSTRGRTLLRGDVCHAELTCGAISLHRAFEGLAIGALYSAGAVVGILGAVTVAGHTALETGAMAGQYRSYRSDAIAAIGLVQCSYVGGVIVGVGLTVPIPAPIQSASLAFAAGILFAIGVIETRNTDILSHAARVT